MHNWKGFSALLITGFLSGTVGIFIRYLNKYISGPQQIIYLNVFVFCLLLLLVLVLRKKISFDKKMIKFIFLYGIFYGFGGTLYTLSILTTKISTTVFGIYASILCFSLLFGFFLFKEKITTKKVLALILACIGFFLFTYPLSFQRFDIGLGFSLVSGFMAIAANSIGKYLGNKVDNILLVLARTIGIGLGGVIFALYQKESLIPAFTSESFILLFILAGIILTASFTILIGFNNFDLNLGAILVSSELLFATTFAAVFFKEYPKNLEYIGGFFILCAICIANLSFRKKKQN